tara:strand:+ start:40788 stop:40889 length:102 start_codon:yes stop_codon:yes gene_type:complete
MYHIKRGKKINNNKTIFVTGKRWDKLFEVEIIE